jgi:hypothetical protein
MSYVGAAPKDFPTEDKDAKFYNLFSLLQVMAAVCGRWAESYNKDRSKFERFLDRYDLIVSHNRMLRVNLDLTKRSR